MCDIITVQNQKLLSADSAGACVCSHFGKGPEDENWNRVAHSFWRIFCVDCGKEMKERKKEWKNLLKKEERWRGRYVVNKSGCGLEEDKTENGNWKWKGVKIKGKDRNNVK